MKNVGVCFLVCVIISLVACSSVGGLVASSPEQKISQAYQLKNQGRPVPAQDLLKEAQETYESNKNIAGLAEVNMAFGNLYKSDSYQNMSKVFKRWKEYKSYMDAVAYFAKAVGFYIELDKYLQAGLAKTGEGDAYYLASRNEMACAAYLQAERYSLKVGGDAEPLLTRIRGFRANVSCPSA